MNRLIGYMLLVCLVGILFSCRDTARHSTRDSSQESATRRNFERLQGEWQAVDEESMEAYVFREDSTCIYTPGYYTYHKKFYTPNYRPSAINFFLHIDGGVASIQHFLGSETAYFVKENELILYNPESRTWDHYSLQFRKADTLLLAGAGQEKVFAKKQYEPNTPLFDQIILSIPVRWIPSELEYVEKRISLKRSGEIWYYKESSCDRDIVTMLSQLKPGDYDYMEGLFKQADILNYITAKRTPNKKEKEMNKPHWEGKFSITFIRNDRMITVEEPLDVFQTKEFYWAYLTAMYADERDQIVKPLDYLHHIGFYPDRFPIYDRENRILKLAGSEQFYLFTLLYRAEETDRDFNPLYRIPVYEPYAYQKTLTIETDGRYFRYFHKYETVTLDIGFNFIERNNLSKKFQEEDSK